jgi:hypothetical protein
LLSNSAVNTLHDNEYALGNRGHRGIVGEQTHNSRETKETAYEVKVNLSLYLTKDPG